MFKKTVLKIVDMGSGTFVALASIVAIVYVSNLFSTLHSVVLSINSSSGCSFGLICGRSTGIPITGNNFSECSLGCWFYSSAEAVVENNTVSNCSEIAQLDGPTNITSQNNTVLVPPAPSLTTRMASPVVYHSAKESCYFELLVVCSTQSIGYSIDNHFSTKKEVLNYAEAC